MENIRNKSVGEIVKLDFRAADVFSSYGIDFCCGGKISVADACANAKTEESLVIGALEDLKSQQGSAVHDFDSWDIGFLTDYIIHTHHQYVTKSIEQILPLDFGVAQAQNLAQLQQIGQAGSLVCGYDDLIENRKGTCLVRNLVFRSFAPGNIPQRNLDRRFSIDSGFYSPALNNHRGPVNAEHMQLNRGS